MILQHQPLSCRLPLPHKELERLKPRTLRVLFFDPTPIYNKLEAAAMGDPFKRTNHINPYTIFPQDIKHFCACGCGQLLTGRKTRWASEECSSFAYNVQRIISGHPSIYIPYVLKYYGHLCTACGDMDQKLEIDHIIPVWAGGGLCWLSNLRPLCISCHKQKTKADYQLHNDADQPNLIARNEAISRNTLFNL